MTISQSDLLEARLSPRYRVGIWLARLGNVLSLVLVLGSWLGQVPTQLFFIGAVVLAAVSAPAGGLLFFAIRRLHRGPLHTLDPAIGRAVYRDLYFPKPRA